MGAASASFRSADSQYKGRETSRVQPPADAASAYCAVCRELPGANGRALHVWDPIRHTLGKPSGSHHAKSELEGWTSIRFTEGRHPPEHTRKAGSCPPCATAKRRPFRLWRTGLAGPSPKARRTHLRAESGSAWPPPRTPTRSPLTQDDPDSVFLPSVCPLRVRSRMLLGAYWSKGPGLS